MLHMVLTVRCSCYGAGMKYCIGCEQDQPLEDFYVRAASPDGLQHRCKKCDLEVRRANTLLARYNMTVEDYDALYDAQGGLCAICRQPPGAQRLAVDHCHAGGGVRGLLCAEDNTGLGKLGDTVESLRAALAYLEAHEAKRAQAL